MACTSNNTSKPDVVQRPNNIYGAPQGQPGRIFDAVDYGVQAIILHCTDMTISQYINYLACLTQPVHNISKETNHHYSIGSAGTLNQHIDDENISWTFGNYSALAYPLPPEPTLTIDWEVLQDLNGADTSPDVYAINIVIAKSYNQGVECVTASGLPQDQHEKLIQLLVHLAEAYEIPIDADHINWHDNIATQAHNCNECICKDITCLLDDINTYCDCDCSGDCGCNVVYPELDCVDVSHFLAVPTECECDPVCCVGQVPFDACCLGHLPQVADIEQFVGIATDSETGKLCLVKNTVNVLSPLTGDGTAISPLTLDLCAFGDFVPDGTPITLLGIDDAGCLVETLLPDIVTGNETPLTVIDTSTVDLTVSGINDHTLSADVKISATVGNLLIDDNGLFVSFLCDDLSGLFSQGIVVNIYGVDAIGDCVLEDATQLVNTIICAASISDDISPPMHILGRNTDPECPIFFTPIEVVTAGLSVEDTPTIDLTLTTTVVSNEISGIVNIDPAGDNTIQVTIDGLYVPQLVINTLDNCISAEIISGQFNLGINIDPAIDNILSCEAAGLYVKDLVPTDTDCVNFSYISATRVLSASIVFAGLIGNVQNVVSCEGSEGLYVPRGANLLANEPLIGLGTADNPLDINFSLMDNQDLCDLGSVIPYTLALIDVVGRDSSGCLKQITGQEFISIFLEILDTNTIDLILTGNVLSADAIISPAIGGLANILISTVTGLYVPIGGGINPVDTNCIAIQLVNGTLTITPILDPDSDNQVTCNVGGLFVPKGAGVTGGNTDCISVVAIGGVVTATPIISSAVLGVDNILSCEPSGLFVPTGAGITPINTDCITLTLDVSGDLTPTIVISSLADNQITCEVSGLYVPQAAGLTTLDSNCLELTLINGVLTGQPIIDLQADNQITCGIAGLFVEVAAGLQVLDTDCVNLDITPDGVLSAIITFAPTQGGISNVASCIVGQGFYVPQGAGLIVLDTACIDLDLTGGVLTATPVLSLTAGNQIGCIGDGLHVPLGAGLTALDTDCIDMDVTGGVVSAVPIIAGTQAGIPNILTCILNEGLYVPEPFITSILGTNCVDLDSTAGVLTATIIIDPDITNEIECRVNGLYAQSIDVLDTDCINLEIAGGIISATLIFAPDQAGISNALSCITGQGLFVPRGANAAVNGPLIGDGSDTSPLDIDFSLVDFCEVGNAVQSGTVATVLVLDASDCIRFDTLENVMQSGLTVNNTDCITLSLITGQLSAVPVIAPPQGGVLNALSCIASQGLYVPRGANLDVIDTLSIDLSAADGIITAVIIEAGSQAGVANVLQVVAGGVYVPTGAGIVPIDTNCIDMSFNALTGQISADAIIAPTQGIIPNSLACLSDGLYSPETQIARQVGTAPSGANEIEFDVDGDSSVDFTMCEGICNIVSDNDCFNGGVGAGYMVNEFALTGDTLTINSVPEHTSVSVTGGATNNSPTMLTSDSSIEQARATSIFTNPSLCRSMAVRVSAHSNMYMELIQAQSDITVAIAIERNSSSVRILNPRIESNNPVSNWRTALAGTVLWTEILVPGATVTYDVTVTTISNNVGVSQFIGGQAQIVLTLTGSTV